MQNRENYNPCNHCRADCGGKFRCEPYQKFDDLMCEIAEIENNIEALEQITRTETATTIAPCIKEVLDKNAKRLAECDQELRNLVDPE